MNQRYSYAAYDDGVICKIHIDNCSIASKLNITFSPLTLDKSVMLLWWGDRDTNVLVGVEWNSIRITIITPSVIQYVD